MLSLNAHARNESRMVGGSSRANDRKHASAERFNRRPEKQRRRQYEIDECLKALGRNVEPENIPVSSDPIDFAEWRNLKMKEDALISQNERKIIEGDLLDRDAVLQEIGAAFHSAKTKLLAIPVSIAGVVATESDASVIKEIIEGSVREALAEISATAARLGASSDPQTAAAAHG